MEDVKAYYGIIDRDKAVLEMAQASGLPMVPEELRNPLNTTTYGTGELVLAAVNAGHTDISIAIGGSATNDGGMGFASALGVKFLDAQAPSVSNSWTLTAMCSRARAASLKK